MHQSLRSFSFSISLILVVAWSGCSETQAEKVCVELSEAQCEFAYGCCNAAEREAFNVAGTLEHSNLEQCKDALRRATCTQLAPFSDAEEQGRMEASPEAVDAFLEERKEAADTCDAEVFLTQDQALAGLWVGVVGDNDDCFSSLECATPGSLCVQNDDPNLISSRGYCDAPPAEGEACPEGECRENLGCIAEVCVLLPAENESCAEVTQCRDGLFCLGGEEPLCTAKRAAGDACVNDGQCLSNDCDEEEGICRASPEDAALQYEICSLSDDD